MSKKKSKNAVDLKLRIEQMQGVKCKSKCCKKYKKSERKRCKKCPCLDLIKKVA